jgi:hypothetical protein
MARDHYRTFVDIEYRYAWWLKWYCQALFVFGALFEIRPDVDKLTRVFIRAARFRTVGSAKWHRVI